MNEKTKSDISNILFSLGIMPNYRGYQFTLYSVLYALEDPYSLTSVTKCLYPEVAKIFKTNWESVERNIRTVISQVWKNNKEKLIELSGNTITEKPKPAHFIGIIVCYYKKESIN